MTEHTPEPVVPVEMTVDEILLALARDIVLNIEMAGERPSYDNACFLLRAFADHFRLVIARCEGKNQTVETT